MGGQEHDTNDDFSVFGFLGAPSPLVLFMEFYDMGDFSIVDLKFQCKLAKQVERNFSVVDSFHL